MTGLGMLADLAYLCIDVATRFVLIGEWGPAVAYFATGCWTVTVLTTAGWRRVKTVLAA